MSCDCFSCRAQGLPRQPVDPALQLMVDAIVFPLSPRILDVRVHDEFIHAGPRGVLFLEVRLKCWPLWGKWVLRLRAAEAVKELKIGCAYDRLLGELPVDVYVSRGWGKEDHELRSRVVLHRQLLFMG